MEYAGITKKAQEYEKSETGIEEKERLNIAWEKHREFLKIYPFRTNPAEIDNLTPDMIFNPGQDYFLKWIEHKLVDLCHIGTGSAYYAINAKKDIKTFKELLHILVDDSKPIWQKIDPWDAIKFWGGDRQIAKKILFCYYPETILPVLNQSHLVNFAQALGLDYEHEAILQFKQKYSVLSIGRQFQVINKLLLELKNSTPTVKDWDNAYFMSFLYTTYPQTKANLNYNSKSVLNNHEQSILLKKFKDNKVTEKEVLEAFQKNSADTIVIKALNSLGIKNIPDYENDVVALFSKIHKELGFPMLVEVQPMFPDVIAEDTQGQQKKIELELFASGFDHDPKGCDYIVCWENDLDIESTKNLPEIISLKKYLLEKM
jgi:hypothetical protein